MTNKAPTLREFQARFQTEDACLEHVMRTRFGDRFTCDGCSREAHYYRTRGRRSYTCEHCGFQVYPTAGTPFDRTRTSLRDWMFVMFQFCTSRNGVAAKEVERQLGVTYKTAWRMCDKIREYMTAIDGNDPIGGFGTAVEVDETLIGGRKRGKQNRGSVGKTVVLGMLERGGDVITAVVPNQRAVTLKPIVQANVLPGGQLHSDELKSYAGMHLRGYRHMTVNHGAHEYVGFQGASVNTLEGFWAALKRGISGTHIHVSSKHLPKYLGEFEYRYNMRATPHLMLDRLVSSFRR